MYRNWNLQLYIQKKSQFTRIQITPAYNKCYSSVTNIIYNSIKYARLLIFFFVHAIL
jgi:hypothetical protein